MINKICNFASEIVITFINKVLTQFQNKVEIVAKLIKKIHNLQNFCKPFVNFFTLRTMYKKKKFDLKRFRKERNLSQKEIAVKTNYSPGFISSIESGRDNVSQIFVERLCEIYGIADPEKYLYQDSDNSDEKAGSSSDASVIQYLMKQNEALLAKLQVVEENYEKMRNERDELRLKLAMLNMK